MLLEDAGKFFVQLELRFWGLCSARSAVADVNKMEKMRVDFLMMMMMTDHHFRRGVNVEKKNDPDRNATVYLINRLKYNIFTEPQINPT